MAEPFETLREVGVAIDGIKDQLGTYAKVFGAVVVVGLTVIGFLYNKLDNIEEGVARNTAILERIEAQTDRIASNTDAIKDTVQTASSEPQPGSFPGWVGVKTTEPSIKFETVGDDSQYLQDLLGSTEDSWIFVPQDARP